MFHDGDIVAYEGDNAKVRLTIECEYMAEMISPEFRLFYIELFEVTRFELDAWQNPVDLPPFTLYGFEEVLKAELEIYGAIVKEDYVEISCYQSNKDFNYSGGNLVIKCSDIKVYDQVLNEMTVNELNAVCNAYLNRASD